MTMSINGGMEVKKVFIGVGCNRVVNNVSWGACDLVAFGAQNAVAIFSPKTAQILTTLPGHKASVNCTQWLPSNKFAFKAKELEKHYLLSGDAVGAIILWEFSCFCEFVKSSLLERLHLVYYSFDDIIRLANITPFTVNEIEALRELYKKLSQCQ